MVLLAHPQIEDYLVVQEQPGCLRIHLTTRANQAGAPSASFSHIATAVHQRVLEVIHSYHCRLEQTAGGRDCIEVIEGVPAPAAGAKRRRVQARTAETRQP